MDYWNLEFSESRRPPTITVTALKGHDTSFEDFKVFLKESNKFEIHLKESLPINVTSQNLTERFIAIP